MEEMIKKAADDLAGASHAVALTGAGISTESGVPDFRGPDGIWTKNPEMERKAYQTYHTFLKDPTVYWQETLENPFRQKLLAVEPNRGHYALAEMEQLGVLKAVLSQNVDNLHQKAGSQKVLEYHGSVGKLRCLSCGSRYSRDDYDIEQMKEENRLPPNCQECGYPLKSDVVYFQEPIPGDVMREADLEARKCDVMLICGTSALVYPFASLPVTARRRPGVTIIEVNAEPTALTQNNISDYLIQGKTGEILPRLVEKIKERLGL
ncbi:MAG: SIR2 family NAD-dependent protein deacylase [Desulfobacterales bacterium]